MSNLKNTIVQWVPPAVFSLYKKYISKPNENVFDGVYKHLNDVTDHTVYDTTDGLQEDRNEILAEIAAYEKGNVLPISNIRSQITNLLPLLIASSKTSSGLTVLDFGGGMGVTFMSCLNSVNMDNVTYYIHDLPDTMKVGKQVFHENKTVNKYDVRFVDNLSEIGQIDILYFGSVIQYLPDYKNMLVDLTKKSPRYIMITDNFMGNETFATAQVNMSGRRMPYWILGLKEVVSIFESNGYTLSYQSVNHQPFHHFNNFPEAYRVADTCNLLFAKN
jgi:putative methyltransferase (TIGR04325 family)